jgi:hypothetical protein
MVPLCPLNELAVSNALVLSLMPTVGPYSRYRVRLASSSST